MFRTAAFALLLFAFAASADEWSDWKDGRATFYVSRARPARRQQLQPPCSADSHLCYSQGTDAWSIHKGSCGYGWLDKDVATGAEAVAYGQQQQHSPRSAQCTTCYLVPGLWLV
jgi:hypothetical protein